jgi:hypothetical protein
VVHQGTGFGVDLYELEKIAKDEFPTISAIYQDAVSNCDRVHSTLDSAMRRPEQFGGDGLGPVYKAYVALQDAAVGILKETKTNVDDTATALDRTARAYAETDAAASAEMKRRMDQDPPRPE